MNLKQWLVAAGCAVSLHASAGGLPGMRGGDHLGFTVPDLKQAVDFFTEVIGCDPYYKLGPFKADNDWMQVHLNVNARAEIPTIQVMRCGHGLNLEIFQYSAPEQAKAPPRNSDIGGHHLAFYVEDMDKAVAHLKQHNVKMMGTPTVMKEGPSAGETWMYFLAPWGMQLELVSYPKGKAYEKDFKGRLWNPTAPAK
ncbi:MAG TPA: VOC family protein [Burkholderiales bacterium]|nr:VOC family protein [Burkholderiales bacterium]